MKSRLIAVLTFLSIIFTFSVHAQDVTHRILIPLNSSNNSINDAPYAAFINAVWNKAAKEKINILLLPITLPRNPAQISRTEQVSLMEESDILKTHLENACSTISNSSSCVVTIAPVFSREDAQASSIQKYFSADLDAIFIPEGDHIVASQIIRNTLLEAFLREGYENGIIIGGAGAGALLFSPVLVETQSDFTLYDSLEFGSVETQVGLGLIKNAVIDKNLLSDGNITRLLNTITLPGIPQVGIGLEPDSGIKILDGSRIESVLGENPAVILDARTYHAADAVEYIYPRYLLGLHNVLVHILSQGDTGYDFDSRVHALGKPQTYISRRFNDLTLPVGSGPLILGGDLSNSLKDNLILTRFVNLSGGIEANIVIVAVGYSTRPVAQQAIEKFQTNLRIPTQSLVITNNDLQFPELPDDITGVILLSGGEEQPNLDNLQFIKQTWLSGVPLLSDGEGSALIGAYYAGPHISKTSSISEYVTHGLGLLNLAIVPGILADNRWLDLFELGASHPDILTIGLNKDTALEITNNGVSVLGENAVFLLDLRNAIVENNRLERIAFANGLLDVFVPGERIDSEVADINIAPLHAATPDLRTPTFTPTSTPIPPPTETPTLTPLPTATRGHAPTRTPRPTITPPVVPPPGDPGQANLMILLAVFAVIIVLIGVWINRRHFN